MSTATAHPPESSKRDVDELETNNRAELPCVQSCDAAEGTYIWI
jgi:hypothetical protein